MENLFPSIKSSSTYKSLSVSRLKSQRNQSQEHLSDNLPTPILQKSQMLSRVHGSKLVRNGSKLPAINVQREVPSFSPVITDPYSKLQTNRRTSTTLILPNQAQDILLSYSVKSKLGSLMGKPKEVNQDTFMIHTSLQGRKGQHLFAVCDGHGIEGHHVSGLIKSFFPTVLERNLYKSLPAEALRLSVEEISTRVLNSRIDTSYSGSTLVAVVVINNLLICANVGDSRAVIGSRLSAWNFAELSTDHKPSRKDEAERIVKCGGKIKCHEQGGPLRIWNQTYNLPGLAMTRSIGDKACRAIGLTSEAEVFERKITGCDKFLIVASDGVWEFISSKEAVDIVSIGWNQGKSELSCELLIKEAARRWSSSSLAVDDITVVIVFFNVN